MSTLAPQIPALHLISLIHRVIEGEKALFPIYSQLGFPKTWASELPPSAERPLLSSAALPGPGASPDRLADGKLFFDG